jgi:hypothetical protein
MSLTPPTVGDSLRRHCEAVSCTRVAVFRVFRSDKYQPFFLCAAHYAAIIAEIETNATRVPLHTLSFKGLPRESLLLPGQWSDARRPPLTPEKMLLSALLKEALDTLTTTRAIYTRRANRLWNEAVTWVLADVETYGSFVFCCQHLGIEVGRARHALRTRYGLVLRAPSPRTSAPSAPTWVSFPDCTCWSRVTQKLKVRFADGFSSWVPVSMIALESEVWTRGDSGRLIVDERWARQVYRLRQAAPSLTAL